MDGGGVSQRASIKRSYSTMANPHRDPAPAPAPAPLLQMQYDDVSPDDDVDDDGSLVDNSYDEDESSEDDEAALWAYRQHHARRDPYDRLGLGIEHPDPRRDREAREQRQRERREQREQRERESEQRQREQQERQRQRHYPGDGFDYRRPMPVMDARAEEVRALEPVRVTETVDLTEDDNTTRAQAGPGLALPAATANPAGDGGASRAQRLPRYDRNIIDIPDSDEEDDQPQRPIISLRRERVSPAAQGDHREAAWAGTRRTTSTLRRPGWIRPPSPAMELSDVEFIASRNFSNQPSRRTTPAVMQPRINPPNLPGRAAHAGNDTIDLTADDDDDVIVTRTRNTRGGINADRPAVAGTGVGTRHEPDFGGAGIARLRNMVQGHNFPVGFLNNYLPGGHVQAARDRLEEMRQRRREVEATTREQRGVREQAMRHAYHPPGGLFGGQADAMIGMPMLMDYGTAAFDMGLGARPPTPPYEAPPAPSKGFTRSPEEEEVIVCPNCGDELALGKDEEKQQVWVVKQCGHAYCGTCVANRTRGTKATRGAKGKGKAKVTDDDTLPLPWPKCQVAGCGNNKRLSNKSDLIRVWINS